MLKEKNTGEHGRDFAEILLPHSVIRNQIPIEKYKRI